MKKIFIIFVFMSFLSPLEGGAEELKRGSSEGQVEEKISYANPTLAGLFSAVLPGGGHYYQRRWGKGLFFTFSEGTLFASAVLTAANPRTKEEYLLGENLFNLFQNEHFYNIYSSYQDARIASHNRGYETPIARDSFWDLLKAPVNPSIITRWTFLIPTAAAVGVVTAKALIGDSGIRGSKKLSLGIPILGVQSTLIGIGEEGVFRGFLQPEFTELYGSKWPAIFTQALLFGASHYDFSGSFDFENVAQPIFTGLFGIYDGWIASRNDYSLLENVAAHAWWDFILFTGKLLIDGEAAPLFFSIPVLKF